MTKLLTEQELLHAVELECDAVFRTAIALNSGKSIEGAVRDIVSLIQSQKQAHADMVIGEDDNLEGQTDPEIYFGDKLRNWLRSEQRERNK